jgi:hypothetical protein
MLSLDCQVAQVFGYQLRVSLDGTPAPTAEDAEEPASSLELQELHANLRDLQGEEEPPRKRHKAPHSVSIWATALGACWATASVACWATASVAC